MTIRLSIVVPCLNSHEIVRRQLLHFFNIGLPGDTELILVDDGSDPPIENEFSQIATIHRTNDKRPWTWALARNAGARLAKGEYLLMYDLDHIADRKLIDFVRGFTGLKVQFIREFGVLDECGRLTQDRDVLAQYGLPKDTGLRIGPLPNNFAMRRDLFWELGGYREDLVGKPYPQGEDRSWRSVWRTFDPDGAKVCTHRPKIYMFPNGKYIGDVDADPKGLFHGLTRKTSRNFWHQQQKALA
jgi:glycosyltransferase involved in cell wall biosynthesis